MDSHSYAIKKGDHQGNVSNGIASTVADHNSILMRRRATGEAHGVPGAHALVFSSRSVKNP